MLSQSLHLHGDCGELRAVSWEVLLKVGTKDIVKVEQISFPNRRDEGLPEVVASHLSQPLAADAPRDD